MGGFLKRYAKDNNITYSCAISDKSASVAYRNMKQSGNSKRGRVEIRNMASEDFEAPIKQVGKASKNPWIQFVKEYSQKNNLKTKDAMKEIKQLGLYK